MKVTRFNLQLKSNSGKNPHCKSYPLYLYINTKWFSRDSAKSSRRNKRYTKSLDKTLNRQEFLLESERSRSETTLGLQEKKEIACPAWFRFRRHALERRKVPLKVARRSVSESRGFNRDQDLFECLLSLQIMLLRSPNRSLLCMYRLLFWDLGTSKNAEKRGTTRLGWRDRNAEGRVLCTRRALIWHDVWAQSLEKSRPKSRTNKASFHANQFQGVNKRTASFRIIALFGSHFDRSMPANCLTSSQLLNIRVDIQSACKI